MQLDNPVFCPQLSLPVTGVEGQTCFITGSGVYSYTAGAWVRQGGSAASSTDVVSEGQTNLYFTAGRVISSPLTGLSTATATPVLSTDAVVVGVGKTQAQITGLASSKLDANATAVSATKLSTAHLINGVAFDGTSDITIATTDSSKEPAITGSTSTKYWSGSKTWIDFGSSSRAVALTGLSTTTVTPVVATDTMLSGVGKLQGQFNAAVAAVAVPASAIDCSLGSYFIKTISAATTFTVSNVPTSGIGASIVLELVNGGSQTVTWFSGITWAGAIAPTLTASGTDIIGFYTTNGGTTWRGFSLAKDSR